MRTDQASSQRLGALLSSALVGAVVGAASAIVVVSSRAGDASPPSGDLELATELRALRVALTDAAPRFEELAEQRRSPELAAPPALPREPAGGTTAAAALLAGLDDRLARLADLLERWPSAVSGTRPSSGIVGSPDFPEKDVINSREFRDRHLLWDYERVLERYGYPNYVEPYESSVSWGYKVSSDRTVRIHFIDGLVLRVWE